MFVYFRILIYILLFASFIYMSGFTMGLSSSSHSAAPTTATTATTTATAATAATTTTTTPLKILSWNIWFESFAYDIRMEMIFTVIKETSPDVICLQEVLPKTIPMIMHQSWYSEYDISDPGTGQSVEPYGVVLLVKKKLHAKFKVHPFPTEMARQLLTAEITKDGETILVGTVHLESLNYHNVREQQLEVCQKVFRNYKNVILCGDFNFCSYRNFAVSRKPLENDSLGAILPEFVDVWPEQHPEEKGYTFDSDSNRNIRKHEVMRYDRFMYTPARGRLRTASISRLGLLSAAQTGVLPTGAGAGAGAGAVQDPYSTPPKRPTLTTTSGIFSITDLEYVYPSDHYGLLAAFTLQ
jgi:endonuclease/exonuclease/phosphatase family metal-dependent hydrolase